MQFPVSSGQHHRLNESEWVPVVPPKTQKKDKEPQQQLVAITPSATNGKAAAKVDAILAIEAPPTAELPLPVPPVDPVLLTQYNQTPYIPQPLQAYQQPAATAVEQAQPSLSIFPEMVSGKDLDVTTIITKRLNAMRKLQDNPLDSEAIKLMYNTQKDVSATFLMLLSWTI